jgi:hypothetical protein
MSVDLSDYFDQFISNISLGEPQVSRMNSAAATVSKFLIDTYGLPEGSVFLQGSYANRTAIEPVKGGEYDVDVVAICVEQGASSDTALNQLEATFRADGRFRDRIKRKKPCVRLEYADDDVGSFHVDVVPVRISQTTAAPLEAPRRHEGWNPTNPSDYTSWCLGQGTRYVRTVMSMKRWRDEQQSVRNAVKSIVLQVLVSQCMPQIQEDAGRMTNTLVALHEYLKDLQTAPTVTNPVLPSENLAKSWSAESFRSFVAQLGEAVEVARDAMASTDVVEAADAWRELLGDDFPVLSPHQLGLELLDYSHAQSPLEMGWAEHADARYGVTISATAQRGRKGKKRRPLNENGELLFQGTMLHFNAEVSAPNHVDIWWQVANTGGHARSRSGLRGEIFKGRDLNGKAVSQRENWESTSYTGTHLIRTLLVRDHVVVASSLWFRVNIYAKNQPFRY